MASFDGSTGWLSALLGIGSMGGPAGLAGPNFDQTFANPMQPPAEAWSPDPNFGPSPDALAASAITKGVPPPSLGASLAPTEASSAGVAGEDPNFRTSGPIVGGKFGGGEESTAPTDPKNIFSSAMKGLQAAQPPAGQKVSTPSAPLPRTNPIKGGEWLQMLQMIGAGGNAGAISPLKQRIG